MSQIALWWRAVRPFAFTVSLIPPIMGALIAAVENPAHEFSLFRFILAGIGLFIGGLLGLVLAVSEKEMAHRGMFALQGILSIILGCLIIAGPIIGAALLVILLGTYFVVWGILSVIMGMMIRSANKA